DVCGRGSLVRTSRCLAGRRTGRFLVLLHRVLDQRPRLQSLFGVLSPARDGCETLGGETERTHRLDDLRGRRGTRHLYTAEHGVSLGGSGPVDVAEQLEDR